MMAGWRNRITGHGEEAPDQLLANPHKMYTSFVDCVIMAQKAKEVSNGLAANNRL